MSAVETNHHVKYLKFCNSHCLWEVLRLSHFCYIVHSILQCTCLCNTYCIATCFLGERPSNPSRQICQNAAPNAILTHSLQSFCLMMPVLFSSQSHNYHTINNYNFTIIYLYTAGMIMIHIYEHHCRGNVMMECSMGSCLTTMAIEASMSCMELTIQ